MSLTTAEIGADLTFVDSSKTPKTHSSRPAATIELVSKLSGSEEYVQNSICRWERHPGYSTFLVNSSQMLHRAQDVTLAGNINDSAKRNNRHVNIAH